MSLWVSYSFSFQNFFKIVGFKTFLNHTALSALSPLPPLSPVSPLTPLPHPPAFGVCLILTWKMKKSEEGSKVLRSKQQLQRLFFFKDGDNFKGEIALIPPWPTTCPSCIPTNGECQVAKDFGLGLIPLPFGGISWKCFSFFSDYNLDPNMAAAMLHTVTWEDFFLSLFWAER